MNEGLFDQKQYSMCLWNINETPNKITLFLKRVAKASDDSYGIVFYTEQKWFLISDKRRPLNIL